MKTQLQRLSAARILATILFIGIGLVFIQQMNGWIWPHAFFDARVFVRAIDQIRSGHGPYDLIYGPNPDLNHLPLVYPPTIGWLVQSIAHTDVSLELLKDLLSAMIILGMAAGIVASAHLFYDRTAPYLILCVGVFAAFVSGAGMIAAVTGNISILFWGCILASSLAGFGKDRWAFFHFAVFVASLCKPYFAALWIVPVLATGWSWRQAWIGSAIATLVVAIYALVLASEPGLTAAWLATLASRVQVGDAGFGLYGLLYRRLGNTAALAIHVTYILALLGMLSFRISRGRLRYASLFIIAILANPRLNAYDFAFAAIPAFYIYSTRLDELTNPMRGGWLSLLFGLIVAGTSCEMYQTFQWPYKLFLMAFLGGAVLLATQWNFLKTYLPARASFSPE